VTVRAKPGRAVFLDRDGTLVDELGYLARPEDLRLLPGAAEGVRRLNEAGWRAVVVTNQSGIARGLFGPGELDAVHARLAQELALSGAHLDGIYSCPHHPEHGTGPLRQVCACRKPAPGLLLTAARELGLDLAASWIVGDSLRDLEAGARAGLAGGILVLTGKGRDEHEQLAPGTNVRTAPDLPAAVQAILAGAQGPFTGSQGR
jgi:D-glycero-D-manno-heptose 1,7-bisphosphate phosphatase